MPRKKVEESGSKKARIVEISINDARRLVTVGPEAGFWTGELGGAVGSMEDWKGAIVRFVPPADATEERIETLSKLAETAGAVAVKVLPKLAIGTIGRPTGEAEREVGAPIVLGLREAVHAVAGRMASVDREKLKSELDSVMDEAGL